ncbi:MAG: bifunctional adenosylcobinamide kinase/adenosylcobinamide-phosphate guanylyltransferase [Oscillospiraceae bacterium]
MFTLITGAPGNGKSLMAETIITHGAPQKLYYIATMHKYDEECERRVARHRAMRAQKGFETFEQYLDISQIPVQSNSCYLLECIPNLLANEMFDTLGAKERAVDKILSDLAYFKANSQNFVVVTNEVASDGRVYDEFSTEYIKNIVEINCRAAAIADTVIECVAGIPIYLKGESYDYI